jgi:type IV secretory pathway TrbF-like protein
MTHEDAARGWQYADQHSPNGQETARTAGGAIEAVLDAHLRQITAEISAATLAGAVEGYEECKRRDDDAEAQRRHWRCQALIAEGLAGVLLLLVVGLLVLRAPVRAFVTAIQVDEQGQFRGVGPTLASKYWQPTEGEWRTLLSQWVQAVRWRGQGLERTQMDWAWAKMHTCQPAAEYLARDEQQGKPYEPGSRAVIVRLRSITRSDVPERTYHVEWVEDIADRGQLTQEVWSGTFTVGRVTPTDDATALYNGTGLCVTGYGVGRNPAYDTPQKGKG